MGGARRTARLAPQASRPVTITSVGWRVEPRAAWTAATIPKSRPTVTPAGVPRQVGHQIGAVGPIPTWGTQRSPVFQGVHNTLLFGRGYLDRGCLVGSAPWCTSRSGTFQPEHTAQARALRHLAASHGSWAGSTPGLVPRLDWEVGKCRRNIRGCWRADILAPGSKHGIFDPAVSEDRELYEVRRWRGPATSRNVDDALTSYARRLQKVEPLSVVLGGELKGWVEPYAAPASRRNPELKPWVTWGSVESDGHVYFAPLGEAPRPVRKAAVEQMAGWNQKSGFDGLLNGLGLGWLVPVAPRAPVLVP